MRLRVLVPEQVPEGEPVRLVLRLDNTGGRPRAIHLQGRPPAFDLSVSRPGGPVLWRRLAGQVVPAILAIQDLGPGGAMEFEDAWDQRGGNGAPAGPGEYLVVGSLPTDPGHQLVTPPAPFRIVARTGPAT